MDIADTKPAEILDLKLMGQTEFAEMLAEKLAAAAGVGKLEPSSRKPSKSRTFEVNVTRTGKHWQKVGLILGADDGSEHLYVDQVIEPSLISEWNNLQSNHRMKVQQGDIICAVNNISGDGDRMLDELACNGKFAKITLTIAHGAASCANSSLSTVASSLNPSRSVSRSLSPRTNLTD